jgi:hypothetical protein
LREKGRWNLDKIKPSKNDAGGKTSDITNYTTTKRYQS